MTKPPNRPRDANKLAAYIVAAATGEIELPEKQPESERVQSGRKGGLSGGKARADKLTPEQRQEIAKKAAIKRWSKE